MRTEKKYILSTCENDICIPQMLLTNDNKDKLKILLSEYIRSIIPMHILGIIPQVISLHSSSLASTYQKKNINNNLDDIQSVYGCLTDYIAPAKEGFFWIEFNFELPNDYSANIFEVCQNLR